MGGVAGLGEGDDGRRRHAQVGGYEWVVDEGVDDGSETADGVGVDAVGPVGLEWWGSGDLDDEGGQERERGPAVGEVEHHRVDPVEKFAVERGEQDRERVHRSGIRREVVPGSDVEFEGGHASGAEVVGEWEGHRRAHRVGECLAFDVYSAEEPAGADGLVEAEGQEPLVDRSGNPEVDGEYAQAVDPGRLADQGDVPAGLCSTGRQGHRRSEQCEGAEQGGGDRRGESARGRWGGHEDRDSRRSTERPPGRSVNPADR